MAPRANWKGFLRLSLVTCPVALYARPRQAYRRAGNFDPDKFEDHYKTALVDLNNKKRAGTPITPKERPRGENVVDLVDALRKSIGGDAAPPASKKPAKKAKKASAGQKEMLMPIVGKKPAKEAVTKEPTAKPQRKSA